MFKKGSLGGDYENKVDKHSNKSSYFLEFCLLKQEIVGYIKYWKMSFFLL